MLIIIFGGSIKELLPIALKRIREGASFGLPGGGSFGSAPKMDETNDKDEISVEELSSTKINSQELSQPYFYLVHGAEFTNYPSKGDYLIRVQLRSDDPSQLKKVTKVAYHLHRIYYNRVRETTNAANNFELQFNAYGQFHLRAEVYFEGVEETLTYWRYLNF